MNLLTDIAHWEWFLILLPAVAFLYSSVGHGGASGYLALMALFAFPIAFMRPSALILNVFVAGASFLAYRGRGHFRWKLFLPFTLSSIPASFIGGTLDLDPFLYKRILGVLLVFAVLRILGLLGKARAKKARIPWVSALLIGAVIGLFSGLIGIGGGIILSPVILLMGWGSMKETAAVSALFILVNSLAGLGGMMLNHASFHPLAFALAGIALIGGIWGGRFGSSRSVGTTQLSYLLAVVLLLASIKLLLL